MTTRNSAPLLAKMASIFQDETNAVADVPGIVPALVLQPITTATTSHFSKNGGNALGFSDADGPLTRTFPAPHILPHIPTHIPHHPARILIH
jgi:hypothetical protein